MEWNKKFGEKGVDVKFKFAHLRYGGNCSTTFKSVCVCVLYVIEYEATLACLV